MCRATPSAAHARPRSPARTSCQAHAGPAACANQAALADRLVEFGAAIGQQHALEGGDELLRPGPVHGPRESWRRWRCLGQAHSRPVALARGAPGLRVAATPGRQGACPKTTGTPRRARGRDVQVDHPRDRLLVVGGQAPGDRQPERAAVDIEPVVQGRASATAGSALPKPLGRTPATPPPATRGPAAAQPATRCPMASLRLAGTRISAASPSRT